MILKPIIKILKVINANTNPAHLAGGIAFAMLLALVPANNLLWIVLFALTFFLKVNTTMELVFLGIFKLLAPAFAGPANNIGYGLLTQPGLQKFFTTLANMIVIPFTNFNYSLVTGGFVLGIIFWLPVFFLTILILRLYRNFLREKIAKNRIVKSILKIPVVEKFLSAYQKSGGFGPDLG